MTVDQILEERGKRYGELKDNAAIAQPIKHIMRGSNNWLTLSYDKKEALDMIAAKISRILTGDPDYRDNWDDIIGYATLVANRLLRNQVLDAD